MNVIKMICYRAETAMAETIAPYFYKEKNEKRMLIKQLFNTPADITVKEEEQTLAITIASLSAPRYNEAIKKLCEVLNETETIFPGTNLRLIYKNYVD
jgi:phosphoenolpyruvate carboxylase